MSTDQAQPKDPLLEEGWKYFTCYDASAIRLQGGSKKLQIWILSLGVVATLLVVLKAELSDVSKIELGDVLTCIFRVIIIVIPILISILAAYTNQFKKGSVWVLLRTAAEQIRSEIYCYRTLLGIEKAKPETISLTKKRFSEKLALINTRLMQTDANKIAIREDKKEELPPTKCGISRRDDGFSPLTPDQYIEYRLNNQLNYYSTKIKKLERNLVVYQFLIYISGGIGTFLAAIGWQIWVALATAVAGVFSTYLEYRQIQNTLVLYNQTVSSLNNIFLWWKAVLPDNEKNSRENIEKLINGVEQILQTEQSRWAQQMEEAMKTLQAKQPNESEGKKEQPVIDEVK